MTALLFLMCLFLFALSGYLITYNVEIISIQKTPIQQSWLSIGLTFQLMLPILFLVFRNDQAIKLLTMKYFSLLTMSYFHLYITKFNVQISKHYIKANLIAINTYISYIVMCMIISVINFKYTENTTGIIIDKLFSKETIVTCIFLMYNAIAVCGSLCIDFFKVKSTVNVLKMLNVIYEISLIVFLALGSRHFICFFILAFLVILIDVFLIKIICIDKGRYYYDR